MRTGVVVGFALTLAAAVAAYADQTAAPHSVDANYVVWVEALNLRAGPSLNTDVIRVLTRGEVLANLREEVELSEGFWWRHVRAGESEGWIADWYAMPRDYYDAFLKADELGRAGKAEAMVAAAIEGGREIGLDRNQGGFYAVSPDGKKIILWGYLYSDWGGNYPDGDIRFSPTPVVVFASDRGLVDYSRSFVEIRGTWSGDSRHYAYVGEPGAGLTAALKILDTNSWKRVTVGRVICEAETRDYEYCLAGDYLLWLDREPVKEPGPPRLERNSVTPVLRSYELGTGRKSILLKADLKTLDTEETDIPGWYGMKFYRVKMVAADPCPPGVEKSKLYIKYHGKYGYAANREHYQE